MNKLTKPTATTAFALSAIATTAFADDTADNTKAIEAFYAFLSNPSSQEHKNAAMEMMAEDWQSIGDYSGKNEGRDDFVAQVPEFGKLMPDLNWEIVEMLNDGNRYIIRGRATGTPQAPFFGVDGEGRSFDIMSIDIHTVEDGQITESYHIEDWAGAMGQLKGQ